MNNDMFVFVFKQALLRSLQSGGVTMIEELADSLPTDALGKFIAILQKVYKKKRNVIHVQT